MIIKGSLRSIKIETKRQSEGVTEVEQYRLSQLGIGISGT